MNFLELVSELNRELGLADQGPATIADQRGIQDDLITWVRQGWIEIQSRHKNWRWMRRSFDLPLREGVGRYRFAEAMEIGTQTPLSRFQCWFENIGSIPYLTTGTGARSTRYLSRISYDEYRYLHALEHSASYPNRFAISPQDEFIVYPDPVDDDTVVHGEYKPSAQILGLDTDVPEMPSDYHYLIVYYAMATYGAQQAVTESYTRGRMQMERLMRQLEMDQLPRPKMVRVGY